MFIVDFFKTISAVKKAKKYAKEHEKTVNNIKAMITKVQKAIEWYETNKYKFNAKISEAKDVIEKLKGFINK